MAACKPKIIWRSSEQKWDYLAQSVMIIHGTNSARRARWYWHFLHDLNKMNGKR